MNYDGFYDYLCELVDSYKERGTLNCISLLAKKHGCASLSKEQFYEFGLNQVREVSRLLSDDIRNRLSLSRKKSSSAADTFSKKCDAFLSMWEDELKHSSPLVELPKVEGSPFRYALCPVCAIDDVEDFSHGIELKTVINSQSSRTLLESVGKQIDAIMSCGSDGIRFLRVFNVPSLCYAEYGAYFYVAFVKANNNGSSFWLSDSKEVLLLLSYLDSVVRKN